MGDDGGFWIGYIAGFVLGVVMGILVANHMTNDSWQTLLIEKNIAHYDPKTREFILHEQ